jgi:hypothetical protein
MNSAAQEGKNPMNRIGAAIGFSQRDALAQPISTCFSRRVSTDGW